MDRLVPDPTNPQSDILQCGRSVFKEQGADDSVQVATCPQLQGCSAWVPSQKVFRTPGTDYCGRDLALVLLSRPIDKAVAPWAEPFLSPLDTTGTSLEFAAVGYGATDPSNRGAGTRRIRQHIPIACISGASDPTLDCFRRTVPEMRIQLQEFIGGAGLCGGDSGLGAIDQASWDQGQYRVFGVLSRGTGTDTECTQSLFVRTDSWKDLIVEAGRSAASALGQGQRPPSWLDPYLGRGAGASTSSSGPGATPCDRSCNPGDPGCTSTGCPDSPRAADPTPSSGCAVSKPPRGMASQPGALGVLAVLASALVGGTLRRVRRSPFVGPFARGKGFPPPP